MTATTAPRLQVDNGWVAASSTLNVFLMSTTTFGEFVRVCFKPKLISHNSYTLNSTWLLVELVELLTKPSMYGKFSEHAWRSCGILNKEHSILVH